MLLSAMFQDWGSRCEKMLWRNIYLDRRVTIAKAQVTPGALRIGDPTRCLINLSAPIIARYLYLYTAVTTPLM